MKKSFIRLAALVAALLMTVTVSAKKQDFGGRVIDEKGEPMAFVNVILLSLPDSVYVQGAMTNEQGEYKIVTSLKNGLLKVTSVGYETLFVKAADGLTIQMKEDTKLLGEVVVKGHLPKVKLTGEGIQTSIQGSVLENAGTANDVLAKTPGMMTGQNGLEVIGKGSPLVYINGRRVTDSSELQRLQSNEIQSIEVITNPGAQYDATVRSVVRIRTIRRQGDGFSYNLYASDTQSLRWSEGYDPKGAFNVNYRTGGVDIFAGINYARNTSRQESDLVKATFGKTADGADWLMENRGSLLSEYIGQSIYGNAGANWQLDNSHFLGGKIEWSKQLSHKNYTEVHDNVFMNGRQADQLTTRSDDTMGDDPFFNIGANLYYNGTVNEKLGIDVNLDYYGTDMSTETMSREQSTMTHGAEINSVSTNSGRMYAAKGVLSYPVWKGMLQAGTEETFSRRTDNYSITGIAIAPSEGKVKEDNYAGFATYGCYLPKVGQMNAGLRYEYVRYNYEDKLTPENNLSRSYSNLFPTLSYANQVGRVQLMVNYSAKTSRPSYANLSSAVRYNSRYIWQSGNAQLQPQLSHDFSVTAVWKFITLMVNYTRTNDAIMVWSEPIGNEGVVLVKPRNIETPYRTLAAYATFTPTIGIWSMNYTVGTQPQWLTLNTKDPREPSGTRETKFNGKPIFFTQLNNTFTLKHDWQLELGCNLMSKGYTQNMYMTNHFFNLNAAVQKKLLKNGALVLRLEGNDLTGTAHYNVNTDFGNHTIEQTNRMDTQNIRFSVRYNFNAAQSKYRGTGAGTGEKARM